MGMANNMCRCQSGFVTFNGMCLPVCDSGEQYNSSGVCTQKACPTGQWLFAGECRGCPAKSAQSNDESGDVIGGHCQCFNAGEYESDPYLPSPDLLKCRKCGGGSHYDADEGGCVCDDAFTYNAVSNCCVSSSGGINMQCASESEMQNSHNNYL